MKKLYKKKNNLIKTRLVYIPLLFLLTLLIAGCQKDETTQVNTEALQETKVLQELSVKNNTLVFETVEAYGKTIEHLAYLGDENFPLWENDVSFYSMRSYFSEKDLELMQIHDPLFATLLNPDGIIQIAGNVIKVDMINETVKVIPASEKHEVNDFSAKGIKQYSTEDNVIDILQGEDDKVEAKGSFCNSEYAGWYTWYCNSGNVKFRSRYYKAGIYYSLVSRVESTGHGVVASMSTTAPECWWINKKGTYSFTGYTDETTSNHNLRVYAHMTRRLKDYYFRTYFLFRDLAHPENGYYDPVITIECTK